MNKSEKVNLWSENIFDATIVTYNEKYMPKKGSSDAYCLDLYAAIPEQKEITIKPGEVKIIPLGIKTNFHSKIYVRSSLPLKKGLMLANSVGIIDKDYRNEVGAILYNFSNKPVVVYDGERICQMEIINNETQKISSVQILENKDLFDNWEQKLKEIEFELQKSLNKDIDDIETNNYNERKGGFGSTGGYIDN